MRRIAPLLLAVLAASAPVAAASPAPASPRDEGVTHRVVTAGNLYWPPQKVLIAGDGLLHTNVDTEQHDLISDDLGPDGKPYFDSVLIGPGETAPVPVEPVPPGVYSYTCSIHPFMQGTLEVKEVPPVPVDVADVTAPSAVAVRGDSVYVASRTAGTVSRATMDDQGLLSTPQAYATGFDAPEAIAFASDGTLFVADGHPTSVPGRAREGRVWAIAPGGGAASTAGEVVIDGLPNGRNGTTAVAVNGGRLYVANGTSTDDGVSGGPPDEPLSGVLLSMPVTARGLTPADAETDAPGVVVEARGLRDVGGIAFDPGSSDAWITNVGPSGMAPFGEDLLVRTPISAPALDFGFPACVYRQDAGGLQWGQNPAVAGSTTCDGRQARPELGLGIGAVASGAAFGPDDALWREDLFVTMAGTPGGDVGHAVLRIPVHAGVAGAPQVLHEGGGPVDLAFGPRGMYVADAERNRVVLLRRVA